MDLRKPFRLLLPLSGLCVLAFAAYGRSILFGYAPIDDLFVVVRNLATRGPSLFHLRLAFTTFDPELYIPLTLISFQLNYLLSGLAPWSYHLTNVLLHACNAFLLFLILRKTTGAPRASFFAAALFVVHPLNTEAVVWITARKDLLSTFFALASVVVFLRRTRGSAVVSVILFLLALLAKVSVAPLPLILPLLLLLNDKRPRRKEFFTLLPFLLLSVIFLGIGLLGKERIVQTAGIGETLLLIPRSTLFLIGKFLFPQALSPLYEMSGPVTLSDPWILASLFIFLMILSIIGYGVFRSMTTRQPSPFALSLIIFFLLFLPNFLTFRKAGTVFLASDRYLYLPSLGLFAFTVLLLRRLDERWGLPRPAGMGAGAVLIAILCLLSVKQTSLWSSAETLFAHAVAVTPRSVAAHIALAQTKLDDEDPQAAFAILKESLKQGDDVRLHLMAGTVYARVGQVPDALGEFEKVTRREPKNAEAWFSIGSLKEQTGDEAGALDDYRTAAALDASDVPARVGIGRLLAAKGDYTGAEHAYREALQWNVNSVEAHRGLATVLAKTGRTDEAQMHLELGLELAKP